MGMVVVEFQESVIALQVTEGRIVAGGLVPRYATKWPAFSRCYIAFGWERRIKISILNGYQCGR